MVLLNAPGIYALDNMTGFITEKRHFAAKIGGKLLFGPADNYIRMHSGLLKSLHRVLRGLGFKLFGGCNRALR